MSLFRYLIGFGNGNPVELVVYAYDEDEAFRKVEAKYPDWLSVELVHSMRVGL